MKHIWITTLFTLLALVACNRSGSKSGHLFEKKATGLPFEVVVVMEKPIWQGRVGDAVHAQLTAPVPALPQSEPKMKVMYAAPKDFEGLMRYVRNILIVDVNPSLYTRVSLQGKRDKWASGQLVQVLTAPDTTLLLASLKQGEIDLTARFEKAEREHRLEYLQQTHNSQIKQRVADLFGVTLLASEEMNSSKEAKDFLWVSDNGNRGRSDLLVYSFPFEEGTALTSESWIAMRDSVLQRNLPGSFEGSYMTTEKRLPPLFETNSDSDSYGLLRGLWRMQGDMMGGPFVARALYDKSHGRMIVAEAFVYAPETHKANLMRRAEASLYTFRLSTE